MGYTSTLASAEAAQRYHRLYARLKRCTSPEGGVDQSIAMSDQHDQSSGAILDEQNELNKSTQTESSVAVDCACQTNIPDITNSSNTMLKEIQHLQQCINVTKDDYGKKVLTEEALKNDKKLLKFYTGKQQSHFTPV